MYKCKICNKNAINNLLGFSIHLKMHNISLVNYYIKYEKFQIPKCKYCSNSSKHQTGLKFRDTCASVECIKKSRQSYVTSNETKEKLRKYRFDYLKKRTGQTAWERRNQGKMSYLESWFFDNVITKYDLLSKYDIWNEYPVYPYFIDFAFLNIHVAVELDGKCHFVNGDERVLHDTTKEEFLIKNGWKVFRIKYDDYSSNVIIDFLNCIGECVPSEKIFSYTLQKGKIPKEKKYKDFEDYKNHRKVAAFENQKINVDKIKNSGIDFSIYGWNSKVCKILNVRNHTYASEWMKKYAPEIYTVAYKRKSSKIDP